MKGYSRLGKDQRFLFHFRIALSLGGSCTRLLVDITTEDKMH